MPKQPDKKRARLFYGDYKKIYDTAKDMRWFQIAMEISLYTTLRLSDVASLRFDQNVSEGGFYVITKKSANQRGLASASRLRWEFSKHPIQYWQVNLLRLSKPIIKHQATALSHSLNATSLRSR